MSSHRSRLILAVCALSLSACGPTPTSSTGTPSSQPSSAVSSGPDVSPSPSGPAPSGSPATPEPGVSPSASPSGSGSGSEPGTGSEAVDITELVVRLQADAALFGFSTAADTLSLCMGKITQVHLKLQTSATLSDAMRADLVKDGYTVTGPENGVTTLTRTQSVTAASLQEGIAISAKAGLGHQVISELRFLDANGNDLGGLSFDATSLGSSKKEVGIQLKPADENVAGSACPLVKPVLMGAQLRKVMGPLVTMPLPTVPANLQVVESTSSSLTLQWDFPSTAASFRLFLNGTQVAANYVSPNYYVFSGLNANTTYTLGVQSVNDAGNSGIATLQGTTLSSSGRSASGNFSGGGSSHRSSPSPSPSASSIDTSTFSHTDPDVASDSDGDFVIVYTAYDPTYDYDIYGQRYNSSGTAVGSEFRVNSYTTGTQEGAVVSMDNNGDFVVAWESDSQDGSFDSVYAQRYASSGAAVGSAFRVNTYTTGDQFRPDIAVDDDGDFVVVWESGAQDSSGNAIQGQRYTSGGDTIGCEFRVNTYTSFDQRNPAVAIDDDGDFVVAWQSYRQDGNDFGIFAQRYTSSGGTNGSEFLVNTRITANQFDPAVAMDDVGNFVVTWASFNQDGSGDAVIGKFYSSGGTFAGTEFRVNSYTSLTQGLSAAAMDDNGQFVVTWLSDGQDGSGLGIYGQFYTNGFGVGPEFPVNTYTTGNQTRPAVAMDDTGNHVVVWQSEKQEGFGNEILFQRFPPQFP
ncbi:MAG: fibronectin type III domain-containing protein [Candidatus Sericytochromatia bacterium]